MSRMDNLTHLVVAGTLGYALRPRGITLPQIGVMSVAAIIPDIEWPLGWINSPLYLKLYHGPTHSILGAAVLAALVGLAAWRYGGVKSPWLVAFLGAGTHLLLDAFTGFGEELFWPFRARRV